MNDIEEVKAYIEEIEIFTEKLEKLREFLNRYEEMLLHIRKVQVKSKENIYNLEETLPRELELLDQSEQ